jgi:DedD protein
MQQRLKQRLVGAIVLVALAVIFIPMLLQGPVEREATSIPMEIPQRPVVAVQPQPAAAPEPADTVANPFTPATPVAPAAPVEPPPAAQRPADKRPAPATTPAPPASAPVAAGEPVQTQPQTPPDLAAWAVQVGSFGTEANALALRDSLRAKGYRAYTEAIKSSGKTYYRVRVGPTIERAEAEKLQATLAGKESLKGLIVPHP